MTIKREWKECPRDPATSRWAMLHASMNPSGMIALSRFTHEALEKAEAFVLLFDPVNNTIGLKPARVSSPNAYPAAGRGKHGGRVVRAFRLTREFGINLNETIRFERPEIDEDGILLLDLRNAKSAARSVRR